MDPLTDNRRHITRRALFGRTAAGVGTAALASLLGKSALASPLSKSLPHFAPKAKRVIYLFQNGAPSHADLFDYKPKLREWHGREIPAEIIGGKRFSTMTGGQKSKPALSEITKFAQHG